MTTTRTTASSPRGETSTSRRAFPSEAYFAAFSSSSCAVIATRNTASSSSSTGASFASNRRRVGETIAGETVRGRSRCSGVTDEYLSLTSSGAPWRAVASHCLAPGSNLGLKSGRRSVDVGGPQDQSMPDRIAAPHAAARAGAGAPRPWRDHRPLRRAGPGRARRDGRGLRRVRSGARSQGRGQAAAGQAGQRRLADRRAAADAARGAGDRAPLAPERRRRLRRRDLPRPGLHRDGVRRREHGRPTGWRRSRAAGRRCCGCSGPRGGASWPRTKRGSSTATSSPTTSWSAATARSASWTSASRAR